MNIKTKYFHDNKILSSEPRIIPQVYSDAELSNLAGVNYNNANGYPGIDGNLTNSNNNSFIYNQNINLYEKLLNTDEIFPIVGSAQNNN